MDDTLTLPVTKVVSLNTLNQEASLFWQYPCVTEQSALERHTGHELPDDLSSLTSKVFADTVVRSAAASEQVYLGLPWATFIDMGTVPHVPLELVRSRLHGLRFRCAQRGIRLRIHTVCQHIFWQRLLPLWQQLGVTDLHLSHLPEEGVSGWSNADLQFHPWHLFAVNVEDPMRRDGLRMDIPILNRRYLASFIGAHGPNYLSPVRERLRVLSSDVDCHIEITGSRWHFESIVYDTQVKRQSAVLSQLPVADDSVSHYNRILSDTQFSLCPAGTGPNSLRFWESLALGCIPVMLGPRPALPNLDAIRPTGASAFSWLDVVLHADDGDISALPQRLRAMSAAEREKRSARARLAYQWVTAGRCF